MTVTKFLKDLKKINDNLGLKIYVEDIKHRDVLVDVEKNTRFNLDDVHIFESTPDYVNIATVIYKDLPLVNIKKGGRSFDTFTPYQYVLGEEEALKLCAKVIELFYKTEYWEI